jgi:hypothetical protein
MKGLAPWLPAMMLLMNAGCAARPDWIQATLVTTDVTGTWRGKASAATITLVLKQQGPKVTGQMIVSSSVSGALEGSVEGDVFRFRSIFGSLSGEATVDGDEMIGQLSGAGGGAATGSGLGFGLSRLFLRRGDSSSLDNVK